MIRGQFGLSTLIILIAIIVTAAVAAGVIIYTANALQARALQTGQQAQERISTGVQITQLFGYQYDPSTGQFNNQLQKVTFLGPVVQLMPGSGPINFENVNILVTTSYGQVYSYTSSPYQPRAVYGVLTGGNVIVTGFVFNNQVNILSVNITNPTICNTLNYNSSTRYVYASILKQINGTITKCSVNLNDSIVGAPISLNQYLQIVQELYEVEKVNTYGLLGIAINQQSVYLTNGELYELLLYLPTPLVTNEGYTIQITPINGYTAQYGGYVPSVLAQSVVSFGGTS
ncbi:MAG: hypothetical protein ACPLX8_00100 [Nanopusillaceae archaeon]